MNDPVKPRIDFTSQDLPAPTPEAAPLRSAQNFDMQKNAQFQAQPELDEPGRPEQLLTQTLRPRRSVWRGMVMAGAGLLVFSAAAQGIVWSVHAWQQQDWLSLGTLAAGTLFVMAGAGSLVTEWRRLYRLRQRADERERAGELLQSHAPGQGRAFCLRLAEQAGINQDHPALQRWQAMLQETQSDREVVTLYAKIVQPLVDVRVRNAISRSAAESALMIAVSPLAIVDMGFIAWRNLRLINHIASLYGLEVGYFSRIRLFRLVLLNIAFAGVSEWVTEVGMDWMSQDLTARLSARVAQGMGAGLLTARLGIKAMELCRPLPWIDGDKPRLGDYRREIFAQLRAMMDPKPPA
ncbi:TIGR01620 family protein [Acerihabitans sp. TG2]|uniref:YcjF family protein n=1 Tax=Acerihabitans sp. TG2 TaxID=3096008 RepID=UPI002B236870|nr:TIGR01620 family protein [Acerihabitans sp. TG2]MEA9389389.1 TIGR01620 family protein [Acerihabitans sp. TG2]